MANKADFLETLKRNFNDNTEVSQPLKNPEDLLIQIFTEHDVPYLQLVDSQGTVMDANDYHPIGRIGSLLRILANIGRDSFRTNVWGTETSGNKFSFYNYPYLAPYLELCTGILVDRDMKHLDFVDECHTVSFTVKSGTRKTGEIELKGVFKLSNNRISCFLSPTMALTASSVCRTMDVGGRYADFSVFSTEFDVEMSDAFFSIFFSTVENVRVNFEGRSVRFPEESVNLIPILVIEKIDVDNSLFLRVSETAGDLPMDICENFMLSRIAHVTDKTISVRKLGPGTLDASTELIFKYLKEGITKKDAKAIWQNGHSFIVPHEIASNFLFNSFHKIISTFRIVGVDKLKKYKIVPAKPRLKLRLGSGIDFLEGKGSVNIDGQEFTIRDLIKQYSHNKYITLNDGNLAVIDPDFMKRIQRIFRKVPAKGDDVKISFFDLPEVMELLDEGEKASKSFEAYRKFYEGFNSLGATRLSTPGLTAKLRGYQKEGVKWLNYLYNNRMGGCLADDMGLGKTVQTIAMLTRTLPKAKNPSLIVMPRSLLFNWQEEFSRFAPDITVATHYGTSRDLDEAMKSQVILTTYAMVRNDIEILIKKRFDCIILDESQNIKNVDAQVTKAVWLLKGEHRLAISGTPIENDLTELYSLFRFLNPTMFGSLKEFNDEYALPIQHEGNKDASAALRRKIFPFMLRRLKQDVLSDLPPRTEQVLTIEMSPRQAALYEERRKYYADEIGNTLATSGVNKASFELFRALLELRQIASIPEEKSKGAIESPKINFLMEELLSAVSNGHKVVVFYNFIAGIELTATRLEREHIGFEIITGATRDRKKAIEHFQNDEYCHVMLMTMKTGGVGLNLVVADTVFVVEPWWNKAAEDQAINRLHRIGQKHSVNCYYLITADSIEEKIRLLQEKKSALVDTVIASDTDGSKNLSAEDINYLLS